MTHLGMGSMPSKSSPGCVRKKSLALRRSRASSASTEQVSIACSANRTLARRRTGTDMPIKRELRWFYPIDWPEISRRVRFERAGGVCEKCGRPHGEIVICLPDGRWFDAARQTWRSYCGRAARWPDIAEAAQIRRTRIILAAAHLDHDPSNNRLLNLKSLCQRCHMIHDRPHHLVRRRITYLLRRAFGDLFLGSYSASFMLKHSAMDGSGRGNDSRCLVGVVLAPSGTSGLDRAIQQEFSLVMP